jgi:glycosyltransferase involved in cell wall biosynthesis
MRILLLNTFDDYGGASLACSRLLTALNKQEGIEAKLLVHHSQNESNQVHGVASGYWAGKAAMARFAWERMRYWMYARDKSVRFAFSPADVGVDISNHAWVQEADILHLHWINFGFLSLKSLDKLIKLGKPIVWTLHDMWAFTGGCHYAGTCEYYKHKCGNCQFLKKPHPKDWSAKVFQQKFRLYQDSNIHFVTCSQWLADIARESSLLKRSIHSTKKIHLESIPNPIDTEVFKPINYSQSRKKLQLPENKFLLLFGAMNTQDKRKGFIHLANALRIIHQNHPQLNSQIELVVFGKSQSIDFEGLPFHTHHLGVLRGADSLRLAYDAADAFVLPSLEDNLPNTVMEALACGTPCIAFRTGGLPEMISHQVNGYLADYQSDEDLAKGILTMYEQLKNQQNQSFAESARAKVLLDYSEDSVGKQYLKLYTSLIGEAYQSIPVN